MVAHIDQHQLQDAVIAVSATSSMLCVLSGCAMQPLGPPVIATIEYLYGALCMAQTRWQQSPAHGVQLELQARGALLALLHHGGHQGTAPGTKALVMLIFV